jgi:hypothetical protein
VRFRNNPLAPHWQSGSYVRARERSRAAHAPAYPKPALGTNKISAERIGGRLAMIRSPVEISTLWLVVQYITEPSETAHL